MNAAATSSKSAQWDRRALRAKSRVVGLNISGSARTGPSAASRARMRWENQRREPDLAADRVKYLQPEPLLSDANYLQVMAKQGRGVPAYAYASNNPLRYIDRDGRSSVIPMDDPADWILLPVTGSLIVWCMLYPDTCRELFRPKDVCKTEPKVKPKNEECQKLWVAAYNKCLKQRGDQFTGECITEADADPAYKNCIKNLPN